MIRKPTLLLGGMLIALLTAIFVGSAVTSAATPTPVPPKTITYSGSTTNNLVTLKLHCDPCVPDILVSGVGQLAFTLTVDTKADLTGTTTFSMTLPSGTAALNQGQGVPIPMEQDSVSGNVTINGIVSATASIQENVPCNPSPFIPPAGSPNGCQGTVVNSSLCGGACSFTFNKTWGLVNQSQTPLHDGQTKPLNGNLKSPDLFDACVAAGLFIGVTLPDPVGSIGAGLQCPINLNFNTTGTVTGTGIKADRSVVIKAPNPPTIPGTTIDFPKGQFIDLFTIPCSAPASAFINLALTNKIYGVDINATGKVDLQAKLKAVVDLGPLGSFDILSILGINATASINLNDLLGIPTIPVFGKTGWQGQANSPMVVANETSAAKPTVMLGQVSKNKVQPVVNSVAVGTAAAGKPVSLSANATDVCTAPADLHYKWSFSDGGTAFGQSTSHTFQKPGTYSGEVRVTDAAGLEGARDFSVVVAANRTTNIKYHGPISLVPNVPDPIEFDGTLLDFTGNPIAGRTLTFAIKDATGATVVGPLSNTTDVNGLARVSTRLCVAGTSCGSSPSLAAGSYTIVVSFAGDATYNASQFAKKFTVNANRPPVVSPLPAPAKAVWGVPITFSGFATDPDGSAQDTLKYAWNFGDSPNGPPCPTPVPTAPCGNVVLNQKVTHTYIKPGTFTVTLTVTDKDGASSTQSTTVTVNKRKTFLKQCGDVQVASGQRTVNECAVLIDVQGAPVIGRNIAFSMTVAGTKTLSGGPTDANGKILSAFNRNLPAGCFPATISFTPPTGENLYLGSTYSFFFYTSGNGGPQNCTFTSAGTAGYDVNCDGSVNSLDALYILQVVAGLTSFTSCENVANVNGDGVIDALDALVLLEYQAGPGT